jgi:hypothetical protein
VTWPWLKTLLFRTTLFAVLLFVALYYVGDFSGRQSLVLAVIGALAFRMVQWLHEPPPFVPYEVFVDPDMRSILSDFHLLEDTKEAWANMQEMIERLPHHTANIWEYGFRISCITPELIYDSGWKRFMTQVKMYARIDIPDENIYRWQNVEIPHLLRQGVSPYFERGYRGYSLGVVLAKQEWEEVAHSESLKRIPKTDVKAIGEGGFEVKVQLAFIPDDEFVLYSHEHEYADWQDAAIRRREEARAKFGWKEYLRKPGSLPTVPTRSKTSISKCDTQNCN